MRLRSLIFLFFVGLPLAGTSLAYAWSPIDGIERAIRTFEQGRLFEQCDWSTLGETGEDQKKKAAGTEEEPDCE